MIPRFCKLSRQTFDVFSIAIRTYSPRGRPSTTIPREDNEASNNSRQEDEFDYEPNLEELDMECQRDKMVAIESIKDGDLITGENLEEKKQKKQKVPIIECMRKNLNYYKGDEWPKHREIPMASRNWQNRLSQGDYFTIYPYGNFANEDLHHELSFSELGIHEKLLENLEDSGISHPSTIQQLGIPTIMAGHHVALTAETGCGKTLAYLIPIIEKILRWKQNARMENGFNHPMAVIVTPSKELALQIGNLAKQLTKGIDFQTVVLRGGHTKFMLASPPVNEVDLLVGTIGIVNKLAALDIYKFDRVRMVGVDEADTMFEASFSELLRKFLRKFEFSRSADKTEDQNPNIFPSEAQLILTSATMPEDLPGNLHKIIESDDIREVSTKNQHFVRSPQKFLRLIPSLKPMTLLKYVKNKGRTSSTIIFSNKNETCDFISIFLRKFNVRCVNLNGKMPLNYRQRQFSQFQNGNYTVLSSTDAGCRGLDTKFANTVINYDFPLISAEYVHRCGRVGRIGSPLNCRVLNFISGPLEIIMTKKIEFAARRLRPVPMLDFIHLDEDVEDEFKGKDLEKFRAFVKKKSAAIPKSWTDKPEDLYKEDADDSEKNHPQFLPT